MDKLAATRRAKVEARRESPLTTPSDLGGLALNFDFTLTPAIDVDDVTTVTVHAAVRVAGAGNGVVSIHPAPCPAAGSAM